MRANLPSIVSLISGIDFESLKILSKSLIWKTNSRGRCVKKNRFAYAEETVQEIGLYQLKEAINKDYMCKKFVGTPHQDVS